MHTYFSWLQTPPQKWCEQHYTILPLLSYKWPWSPPHGTGTIHPPTLCPRMFNPRTIRPHTLYPGVFMSLYVSSLKLWDHIQGLVRLG